MANWKILTFVCATLMYVEAKQFYHVKREIKSSVCDSAFNNTNKIQCYCTKVSHHSDIVKRADCYPTVDGVASDDAIWDSFNELNASTKIMFTNARGFALKYIPTNAIKNTKGILKLDIKYGHIETIDAFAFANQSTVEEISLSDNQIRILKANAFAHHRNLKSINLDTNQIVEINRGVLTDLPSLEKLYLTSNKITTIHDKAFVHLINLKELEIDRNNIFSLNSETFSGLKNLDKLDLSSNSLEVIGDNTFLPLIRLRILNLDGNKIQMIDERGFHGLSNLHALSLAHNVLTNLNNVKIFEGLISMTTLSLKANQLSELKKEVMAPVINNFYGPISSLDVEDNNFTCDCRLDWFVELMNKTRSSLLKQALENLKCLPDSDLRERYNNSVPLFEDEQEEPQKNPVTEQGTSDYEFYDDTQLDGKLFYTDLKFLLNCSDVNNVKILATTTTKPVTKVIEVTSVGTTTKATPSPIVTTSKTIQVTNQGLLDLSMETSTTTEANKATDVKNVPQNQERKDTKASLYTTSRLATVSAKPLENKYEEHKMASDEAKPDKIKAHRSIQDEVDHSGNSRVGTSDANKNVGCVSLLLLIIFLRFY